MPSFWSNVFASIQEVDLIETGQVKPTAKNATGIAVLLICSLRLHEKVQIYYLKAYQVLA